MKKFVLITLSSLFLLIMTTTVFAQREVRAKQRATNYYTDTKGIQDKIFPDWVVEFEVPANSRAHVVNGDGSAEASVISKSLVTTDKRRNGKIIVELKAGRGARKGYQGDIRKFASYLFVQYLVPFQPR